MRSTGFINDQGTAAAYVQNFDWSKTQLGPKETWPSMLLARVLTVLKSGFPTCLFWGPDAICFCNDAYLSAYGLSVTAIGRSFGDILPDLWHSHGCIITRALAGETCFYEDLPLTIDRSGHPEATWWTFSLSPVYDESEQIVGAWATGHETTGRVVSEQRLRFLLDLSTALRTLSDRCEIVTRVSEDLGRHLGAGRVGYIGVGEDGQVGTVVGHWADANMQIPKGSYRLDIYGDEVLRDLRAGRIVRIDDALADPRAFSPQVAAAYAAVAVRASIAVPFTKDGRTAAIMYVQQATPRRWSEGEIALIQEVAERTWSAVARADAEAALRESEALFRQFGEFSPHVTWIYNVPEQKVEYVSPAYEHVWGEPRDAVLHGTQENWAQTIHPDDRQATLSVLKQALEEWAPVAHEYRILRPDGTVRMIRDICFPIGRRGIDVPRMGGIAQDITKDNGSRVYVVDADATSRTLTAHLLKTSGYPAEEFEAVDAFLKVAPSLAPGCVLLNIQSLGTGAFIIPKQVKARSLDLSVIVIDGGSVTRAVQAMKAGAVDVLQPPFNTNQLSIAVASAFANLQSSTSGEKFVDEARSRIADMTARERDVLEELVQGGSSKAIGQRLGLSPRTVESYRRRVMQKLEAQNLSEAVRIAVAAGLQPKPDR